MASNNKEKKRAPPSLPPWPLFNIGNSVSKFAYGLPNALVPPAIRILDIGFAFTQTHVLYALSKLEIPAALESGPKTAEELAPLVGADADKLFRVLRLAAMYGFIGVNIAAEEVKSKFCNNAISEHLLPSAPICMNDWVRHMFEDGTAGWAHLLHAMKHPEDDGESGWLKHTGGTSYWDYFIENPAAEQQFVGAMIGTDRFGLPGVLADYPWAGASRFVDMGAALGSVLAALMEKHPSVPGVLFDQPQVVESAEAHWKKEHPDLLDRVSFVPGDFFKAETMPKAKDGDVYIFRWIYHDWSDKKTIEILKNVRLAFGDAKAKMVIVEVMPGLNPRMQAANIMDVHMMAMLNGKERSQQQWEALFKQTGWKFSKSCPTRGAQHLTEAVPV